MLILAVTLAGMAPALQSPALEDRVKREFGKFCSDPCEPPETRILRLADKREFSEAVVAIIREYAHEYAQGKLPDRDYWYLTVAISMSGKIGAADALPMLVDFASGIDNAGMDPREVLDLRLSALRSIGEIDPEGKRTFC